MSKFRIVMLVAPICLISLSGPAFAQSTPSRVIPTGSKVFIAPMENDFNQYLKAALEKKKVPLTVVDHRTQAQFEITGHSDSEKAGVAKKAFMLNWHSNEQASIQIAGLESGEVVFAYSVNKKSSAHGKQSAAEACAKHIKEKIQSGK